jgi:3-isopropylmalate/(R)-2-methylmalate dehydratase small subunit
MSDKVLRGKAWVATNYVMAFDIIRQEYWTSPLDPEENAKWVMANVSPEFDAENAFKSGGYKFIVAGHNFAGGGKSIEHVITGLMGAGIRAVLADSFARLQFRNAINYGLPFITCREISKHVATGDELEIDLESGAVKNITKGTDHQAVPIAPFVREIAAAGGLLNYVRGKIADGSVERLR